SSLARRSDFLYQHPHGIAFRQRGGEPPMGNVESATIRRRTQCKGTEVLDAVGLQQGDLIDELEAGSVPRDLDGPHLALTPLAVEDAATICLGQAIVAIHPA